MNVGFMGLGNMGTPMALNILKGGHQLTVYNRTVEKAGPLNKLARRWRRRLRRLVT